MCIRDRFISHSGGNSFWGDSIKFLNPLSTEHPPLWFLLTTPALVLSSIPIAYYFFVKDKNVPHQIAQSNRPLYNFLMIRRPPRSTHCISSAASDVYKRQP